MSSDMLLKGQARLLRTHLGHYWPAQGDRILPWALQKAAVRMAKVLEKDWKRYRKS